MYDYYSHTYLFTPEKRAVSLWSKPAIIFMKDDVLFYLEIKETLLHQFSEQILTAYFLCFLSGEVALKFSNTPTFATFTFMSKQNVFRRINQYQHRAWKHCQQHTS